jgi:DNA end-binding protein Ku
MRSMWKGSLSFGLVNIPVEMYVAGREREFKFVLLHEVDYSPIRYARICKEEDKEVSWSHVVKGYETEEGNYIILTEEELKKASKERTDIIDIKQFTDEGEVDPIYFDKPYYLQPLKGAYKAYALLMSALKKSKKVGIATYVIHSREHLGVIRVHENLLVLNQLRFANELADIKEFKIPKDASVPQKEVDMAIKLIDQMNDSFNPNQFKDSYTEAVRKIINQKESGKKVKKAPSTEIKKAKVYDLMSALKKSLDKKAKKKQA